MKNTKDKEPLLLCEECVWSEVAAPVKTGRVDYVDKGRQATFSAKKRRSNVARAKGTKKCSNKRQGSKKAPKIMHSNR